jgi:hypothetical protein
MNKGRCHVDDFGWFSGTVQEFADQDGHVEYIPSKRYESMSVAELKALIAGRHRERRITRSSAAVELASRQVAEWRRTNG